MSQTLILNRGYSPFPNSYNPHWETSGFASAYTIVHVQIQVLDRDKLNSANQDDILLKMNLRGK